MKKTQTCFGLHISENGFSDRTFELRLLERYKISGFIKVLADDQGRVTEIDYGT